MPSKKSNSNSNINTTVLFTWNEKTIFSIILSVSQNYNMTASGHFRVSYYWHIKVPRYIYMIADNTLITINSNDNHSSFECLITIYLLTIIKSTMCSQYQLHQGYHTYRIVGTRKCLHSSDLCQTIEWSRQLCTLAKVT